MLSIPGKIPVHVYPFFWLLITMIGWLNSGTVEGTAIWAVVIFISILIHEFGHALTAVAFGQTAEISLVGMGGVTKRHGEPITHWKEFFIVLNGPIAGFILFAIAYHFLPYAAQTKNVILIYGLKVAVEVNLFWTLLNLVPVLPLDGGQLLRIVLEGVFGFKGLKAALLISIILSSLFGLYFFSTQQILIGALFLMLGFESYKSWAEIKPLTLQDNDKDLQNSLQEAIEELRVGNRDTALAKFFALREQVREGMLHITITEYIARILSEQGHYKEAYEWLLPLQKKLSPDYLCLLQQLAYKLQDWEKTTSIGQEAYQQEPQAETALLNALSYAIMGQTEPAVGWLRCSIQSGLTDVSKVINRREFDAIRDHSEFEKLSRSVGIGSSQ